MGQPLSMDLRRRLLAAIDGGMSCRAAATRFGVAPATAIRWRSPQRATGHFVPKAQGGDMRSRRVDERRADILGSGKGGGTSRSKSCAWRCSESACTSLWPGCIASSSAAA